MAPFMYHCTQMASKRYIVTIDRRDNNWPEIRHISGTYIQKCVINTDKEEVQNKENLEKDNRIGKWHTYELTGSDPAQQTDLEEIE